MLKNQKAFTLIELLVTLVVVGILFSLALPNFNRLLINNKSVVLGEDLIAQLNLARYEAIKRSTRVTICASSNSTTSSPSCTGNWTQGILIFEDKATSDGAASPDLGSVPKIIKAIEKADNKASITVKNDSTAVTFIRFTSLGTLGRVSNSSNPIIINASVIGCKGGSQRDITIGLSGIISAQKVDCP